MRLKSHAHHLFPVVAFALTTAAFYPGHLSFDSAFQFWQARTGQYANLSPVAMTGLWALVHRVWPGSGGMFVLHALFYWAGVWLVACTLFDRPWPRIAAAALASVATPAHLVVVHLWTDAALIAALGFAVALVLRADATRTRRPLIAALPFLLYGGLVRHNALPALVPLVAWWTVAWTKAAPAGPPAQASPMKTAIATAIAIAAVFGAGRALDRALVVQRMSTFGVVQLWDLTAVSLATGEMLVPDFARPDGITLDQLRAKMSRYANVPLYAPHVKAGTLRLLAVTRATRIDSFPDVPTLAEAGVRDFDVSSWYGLSAATGTPPAIIQRLGAEVVAALADPAIQARIRSLGAEPAPMGPEAYSAFMRSELERWAPVVKASGAVLD